MVYIYLMNNSKNLNLEIVESGKLILCGPFTDYAGGMVVLNCKNIEEAREIAETDPFIAEGYKTYELRTLEIANKENNYGL